MRSSLFERVRRAFHFDLSLPWRLRKRLHGAGRSSRSGDFASAARQYKAALALMPVRTDIRIQLANMLKDSGRFEEAEAHYLEALSKDPLSADIHLQLGHLHKLAGRRGLALAAYRRALELNPLLGFAQRELAAAGEAPDQMAVFDAQIRQGGGDALLTIRSRLDEIAAQINEMRLSLPDARASVAFPIDAYPEMRRLYDIPPPPATLGKSVVIAVILLADRESLATFHSQILAIRTQVHPTWTLTVLGIDPDHRDVVQRAAASDSRITWRDVDDADLAKQEYTAAQAADADWVLFLARGACLHAQALAWIAAVAARTGCDAIVADEEIGDLNAFTSHLRPILRQTVDRDTLLEANIYGETIAVRAAILHDYQPDLTAIAISSARSRLLLALVGRRSVAHIPLPITRIGDAVDQGRQAESPDHADAVRAFLGDSVSISEDVDAPGILTIARAPREPNTRIAVILPTKNNNRDLVRLVGGLLSLARRPEALDILILNNGDAQALNPVLAELGKLAQVTIHDLPEPFNWSRFNNLGVAMTTAPYLVFANDDMAMLSQDWDDCVRTWMERDDVGALGARLFYPDETLQHAGVLFDWLGSVIHDGLYQPKSVAGPTLRWHVTRSVSAVTGAFIATTRAHFNAVGGFDEIGLAVSYSDIDYALKLRARGLRILWTPQLNLYHYESKTRGLDHLSPAKAARNEAERRVMDARWSSAMNCEPSLNPFWLQATLPHRLISFPSMARVWRHIERSASDNPWLVDPPSGVD